MAEVNGIYYKEAARFVAEPVSTTCAGYIEDC